MKKRLPSILVGLLFLVGLGIMIYPTVSNQWNTYRQNKLISNYEKIVDDMSDEDFSQEWQNAQAFNETISGNNVFADVFGEKPKDSENSEYNRVLNMNNDGIMGYISIPEINIKLAIYHGTSDDVLQTGVGHINGSKLPIGGESTHCVLAAHRGLPSAELFTDIDQLQTGDKFYLHILDKVLAYEVDQILPMVDKDDHQTLQNALSITEGQDYVSLFTCTPYGVNSHRLISPQVYGIEPLIQGDTISFNLEYPDNYVVEYNGEEDVKQSVGDRMLESIKNYYMLILVLGLSITILVIIIMRYVFNKKK